MNEQITSTDNESTIDSDYEKDQYKSVKKDIVELGKYYKDLICIKASQEELSKGIGELIVSKEITCTEAEAEQLKLAMSNEIKHFDSELAAIKEIKNRLFDIKRMDDKEALRRAVPEVLGLTSRCISLYDLAASSVGTYGSIISSGALTEVLDEQSTEEGDNNASL